MSSLYPCQKRGAALYCLFVLSCVYSYYMDEDSKKQIDELKTELVSLKIRVRRLEEFYNAFPDPSDFLEEHHPYGKDEQDELFDDAVKLVIQHDRASASLIQRRLQLGFNRSARLLEQLEEAGIVSPANGSEPREVLKAEAEDYLSKIKK